MVRRALPGVVERVRGGWGIIGYDIPIGPRRTAFVAWIWAEPVHVHLGFVNGALMSDPAGLMDGRGITKKARWVTLTPDSMLDEEVLAVLLREAARVARLSRDERVLLAMSKDEGAPR